MLAEDGAVFQLRTGLFLSELDDRVVVEASDRFTTFRRTPALSDVLHVLVQRGGFTVDSLATTVSVTTHEVASIVRDLERAGLLSVLTQTTPHPIDSHPADWEDLSPAADSQFSFEGSVGQPIRVGIVASGAVADGLAYNISRMADVRLTRQTFDEVDAFMAESTQHPDIYVANCDGIGRPELRKFNAWVISEGVPALYLDALDESHWCIGPLVVPRSTACYECYLLQAIHHSLAARADAELLSGMMNARSSGPVWDSSVPVWSLELATLASSLEVLKFLSSRFESSASIGAVTVLDVVRLRLRRSEIWRVPRCLVCGRAEIVPARRPWATP